MTVWNKGQYSPVWLEQTRLVSSLLYSTWTKLVHFEYSGISKQKYTPNDCFHGNGQNLAQSQPCKYNQNAWIYLKAALLCKKKVIINS